jgi:hypothetical protein
MNQSQVTTTCKCGSVGFKLKRVTDEGDVLDLNPQEAGAKSIRDKALTFAALKLQAVCVRCGAVLEDVN